MTPSGAPRAGGTDPGSAGGSDHEDPGSARSDGTDDADQPALRAVGTGSAPGATEATTAISAALRESRGLALAYAALDRLVAEHGLTRAAVLVDDPQLGRQMLFDRARSLDDGDLALLDAVLGPDAAAEPGRRLFLAPEPERSAVDADLVVALVEAAVHVAIIDATSAPTDATDVLEIAVRRLPDVGAVAIDRDAGVVQVVTAPVPPTDAQSRQGAGRDLAARVVDLATSLLDGTVAVEILRGGPGVGGATAPPFGAAPATEVELLAVTSTIDTQEIEVHLRRRDVRTIGRAPAAHGLAGGVEATVAALEGLSVPVTVELDWARTVETTSHRRFVVAVAMSDEHGQHRYGLAEGGTPVAAAARAALDAIAS